MNHRLLAGTTLVLIAGGLTGCHGIFGGAPGGELTATSARTDDVLSLSMTTGVYRFIDSNSADVYITDLPPARLADPTDDLAGVSGNLIHIHLFLVPKAGKTPIDYTACNAAMRHVVFASGAMGMYAGGGFTMPDTPGDPTLSGTIDGATMRLTGSTPDFVDKLGTSILSGQFSASLDEPAALAMRQRMVLLSAAMPTVQAKGRGGG